MDFSKLDLFDIGRSRGGKILKVEANLENLQRILS